MKHIYLGMYKQEIVDTDLTFCQGDYGEELVIHGIADSRTARIVFRKPDGNTVERTNLTKDNDVYKYTLQVAELQAIGTVIADVKFTDASSRESSQKFKFTVKPDTINDSVKDSSAWSDSIEQAKTQFAAALVDALTDVENNTAQKIAYANDQLAQLIDTITAECQQATANANAVVTQKTGINDSKSSKTETYSSDKIESIASNLQVGIESACNGVDELNGRLYTVLEDNIDGRTVFNNHQGLSIFKVTTNVYAPKETSETYIVESIKDEYNITQRWISLSDNRVWTRTCDIPNSLLWTSFEELTTQYEETSFGFAGGAFYLKRSGDSVCLYSEGTITENIVNGWTGVIATIPPSFSPRKNIYVPLMFLYGKRLIFRIETDGKISVFAPQQITVEGDDKWIQSSTMYLK